MYALPDILRRRAAGHDPDTLLQKMGYAQADQNDRARLARVLADPELGLNSAEYDFVHDSRGFLIALCQALRVDPMYRDAFLEMHDARREAERRAYKPWLFVDTGFKRSDRPGVPLFALAAMESRRRLNLPPETWTLPWSAQLAIAQQRIQAHMVETGGKLELWGTIRRYLFCYDENARLALDLEGNVLGDASQEGLSQASVQLKGKSIPGLDPGV